MARKISARFYQAMQEASRECTQEFYEFLVEAIRTNKYNIKLHENTLKDRERRGNFDTTPYLDTGELLDSLLVVDNKLIVRSGKHKGGLTYTELWSILEYGRLDKSIPGNRLIEKALYDFKPRYREILRKKMQKHLKTKLKRKKR